MVQRAHVRQAHYSNSHTAPASTTLLAAPFLHPKNPKGGLKAALKSLGLGCSESGLAILRRSSTASCEPVQPAAPAPTAPVPGAILCADACNSLASLQHKVGCNTAREEPAPKSLTRPHQTLSQLFGRNTVAPQSHNGTVPLWLFTHTRYTRYTHTGSPTALLLVALASGW